jgi:hypothetical protein
VPTITKIDPSRPLEGFAAKRGEVLSNWAWGTWESFAREVLQILEKDEVPDRDFVVICKKMTLVYAHSDEAEAFNDLINECRGEKYYGWVRDWLSGEDLPEQEVREEILRKLLEHTARVVRGKRLETFIDSMALLVDQVDIRRENERHILTPNSNSRSIHRLGLERKVSDVLYSHNIKTLGDLKDFVKPPLPGGLRVSFHKERTQSKPPFNPEARLLQLGGIDPEAASTVMEVIGEWDCMMSPATLYI